jgi:hypothetical protein
MRAFNNKLHIICMVGFLTSALKLYQPRYPGRVSLMALVHACCIPLTIGCFNVLETSEKFDQILCS